MIEKTGQRKGIEMAGKTFITPVKIFYGMITGVRSVQLFEPFLNGTSVITSPKFAPIYNSEGSDTIVEMAIATNEDQIAESGGDFAFATYVVENVKSLGETPTFSLVVTGKFPAENCEEFTDRYIDALAGFGYEANFANVMAQVVNYNIDDHDIGLIVANNSDIERIIKFKNVFTKDADWLSTRIVVDDHPVINQCSDLTKHYERRGKKEPKAAFDQEWLDDFYVPTFARPLISAIENAMSHGGYFNLFILGESGSGKTEFGKHLAKYLGFNFVKVNCQMITDPESWFAERGATNGATYIEELRFAKALEAGNAVILLDEINRLTPELANPLLPILDDNRHFEIAGELYDLGKNIVFLMTANVGYQYSGTHSIDTALTNRRNATIRFRRLPSGVETEVVVKRYKLDGTIASDIVTFMNQVRGHIERPGNEVDVDLSTRALLNVAFLVVCGMSIFDAFNNAIFNAIDEELMPKDLLDFIELEMNPLFGDSKKATF